MAKLSPQMWLSIERDYMEGTSKAALSTKYGIARQSIQDHFRSRPHLLPRVGIVVSTLTSKHLQNPAAPIIISAGHINIPAAAAPPNSHHPTVPPYIPPDTPTVTNPKKSIIIVP